MKGVCFGLFHQSNHDNSQPIPAWSRFLAVVGCPKGLMPVETGGL
jgi:hypothetical protein